MFLILYYYYCRTGECVILQISCTLTPSFLGGEMLFFCAEAIKKSQKCSHKKMLKMLFKDSFKFTNEEAIGGYVKYLGIQMRERKRQMHEKQLKGNKILDWWSLVYILCTIWSTNVAFFKSSQLVIKISFFLFNNFSPAKEVLPDALSHDLTQQQFWFFFCFLSWCTVYAGKIIGWLSVLDSG